PAQSATCASCALRAGVPRSPVRLRHCLAEGQARRYRTTAAHRAAELDAHPERRLHEGLDVLAETWLRDTGGFVHDGQLARVWLRRAITVIHDREPIAATDVIEAHVRAWEAARPDAPNRLCEAVRGVLRQLITEVHRSTPAQSPTALVAAILAPSTRTTHDNKRPPPSPHLRI